MHRVPTDIVLIGADHYYSMHMIRHYDEFIQLNIHIVSYFWRLLPFISGNFSKIIQTYFPVFDYSK